MTTASRFKQSDVTRAVNGARKAGMAVGKVEIDPTGKIVVTSAAGGAGTKGNSWDDVLKQ